MDRISSVPNSGNTLIDALVWGARWGNPSAPTTITVGYRVNAGSAAPTAAEIAAMRKVMESYASVINVKFVWKGQSTVDTTDISFLIQAGSSPYLGFAETPGERAINGNPHSDILIWRSNYADAAGTLKPGSLDYSTYLHEFGHALGLAHPHDNGGMWNDKSLKFSGVGWSRELGDFALNQGIYTAMSYNDGWVTRALQPDNSSHGYQATPMALDIQALQFIYGARGFAPGNNSYQLGATHYAAIWDTGGVDCISYGGAGDAVIDLRAASGILGSAGGGLVSYLKSAVGGFTIAKSVVIENASGGCGNDLIRGNQADNIITGNLGRDVMWGGAGADTFVFRTLEDSRCSAPDVIVRFFCGEDKISLKSIDADLSVGNDQAFRFIGLKGFTDDGQVRFVVEDGHTYIQLNTDADMAAEAVIKLNGSFVLTSADFIL